MTMSRSATLASALACALAVVSCSGGSATLTLREEGSLAVSIGATWTGGKAAGFGAIAGVPQKAEITLGAIRAHSTDGTWVDVVAGFPITVDVVSLTTSGAVTLPKDLLPVGSYDALEITITAAHLVLADGTDVTVTPPGGGWKAMIPVSFEVVEGADTIVKIRFEAELSFRFENGSLVFEPEFEVDGVEHATSR